VDRKLPSASRVFIRTAILVLFLSISIAACGPAGFAQGVGATARATTSLTPTGSASGGPNCGTIVEGPNGTLLHAGNAQQVGNCFWQAFRHCSSAYMNFTTGGVDTIMTRIFGLHRKNTGCTITDTVQFRVVPNPTGHKAVYTCLYIQNMRHGLRFTNCGADGTVVVPTSV